MGSNPRGHNPNVFHLGYSPERINPGDPHHRLTTIKKVTSGSSPAIAAIVDALYRQIITAGTHVASTASASPRPPRSSRTPSATSTSP